MKYYLFFILLLAACVDQPRTTPPVLPAFNSSKELQINEGRIVFQQYRAGCHHPMKDATGPAMISVIPTRSIGWLDTFFNHRLLFKPDSAYRARVKAYDGLSCSKMKLNSSQLGAALVSVPKMETV